MQRSENWFLHLLVTHPHLIFPCFLCSAVIAMHHTVIKLLVALAVRQVLPVA